jgi:hypothetical protein
MKQVYRVLAFLVAAGVAVQAAAVSYGMFGLIKWVELGGTLDQSSGPRRGQRMSQKTPAIDVAVRLGHICSRF